METAPEELAITSLARVPIVMPPEPASAVKVKFRLIAVVLGMDMAPVPFGLAVTVIDAIGPVALRELSVILPPVESSDIPGALIFDMPLVLVMLAAELMLTWLEAVTAAPTVTEPV